jgi:hypothetical protein
VQKKKSGMGNEINKGAKEERNEVGQKEERRKE